MKVFSWFKRRKVAPESAAQMTAFERRSQETPGLVPAALSYETYDRMQEDAVIQSALTIKRLGVLANGGTVEAVESGADAQLRAEFVRRALERLEGSAETILDQAMDAMVKGWSIQEIVWEEAGGALMPVAVRPKDPALFGLEMDRYGKVTGLTLRLPGEPEIRLPRWRFILYRHRASYGRPRGKSDLDAAYRHWSTKQTLLAAWKLHLEKFASPTVLGKFERGLPSDEQGAMLQALQNLHRNAAIVYPSEIEIGTLGGAKEHPSGFLEAIDFHNREMVRAIIGQTLTTDEGRRGGSLALGKVHLEVLMLQLAALRRELADQVLTEQFIRPVVELNFGPGPVPRYRFESLKSTSLLGGA